MLNSEILTIGFWRVEDFGWKKQTFYRLKKNGDLRASVSEAGHKSPKILLSRVRSFKITSINLIATRNIAY